MDDSYSQFSPKDSLYNIPMEQNNDDIQDFSNYPRDSFVDHTPNTYINPNKNYSSTPFQYNQEFSSQKLDIINNDNSNECGYSYSSSNLYQDDSNFGNQKLKKKELKKNKKLSNSKNNYKIIRPKDEPIPQDTIIEEEPQMEKEVYNENISNNINIQNNPLNTINEKYNNKNYIEKLYKICRKNGTPPLDGDFSLEGWKLFYPKDEKFFLWEKGEIIPNQILISNENDEDNLEIYEGEINKLKEKHGVGVLTTPKYVRKGTWRDGEFTGWCRESRINGDIFEGKFIDWAIYGKGINKSHKGNLYVGDFVDSKREGKGDLKTKKIHYEGDFKFDKFNGKGKLEFINEGYSYEGEFKNNEISGIGTFKWSNGDIYEGEMINGKMNGFGKYTYSNGQIYEGNYVNGVKEGLGKLFYPNKKIYKGYFKNGKPYGEGTIIVDGKETNIIYKDGKFHKK